VHERTQVAKRNQNGGGNQASREKRPRRQTGEQCRQATLPTCREDGAAKSKFTPGPPIKGDTRSYEVQDGWLIVTTETVAADGNRTGVRFAAKFDGKQYPQIGRCAPTVALISYQPVDKRRLKYTVRDTTGKIMSTNTRTVSADGKTMTIEQKSTGASGRPVVNVELFERQ